MKLEDGGGWKKCNGCQYTRTPNSEITPLAELHRSGSPGAIIAHLISPPPPLHPLRSHFLSFPMMVKHRGNDREQKISVLLTFVCFHVAGSKVSVYSVTWLIAEVNLLSHSPWVQRWGRRYEAGDVSTLGDRRGTNLFLKLPGSVQILWRLFFLSCRSYEAMAKVSRDKNSWCPKVSTLDNFGHKTPFLEFSILPRGSDLLSLHHCGPRRQQ